MANNSVQIIDNIIYFGDFPVGGAFSQDLIEAGSTRIFSDDDGKISIVARDGLSLNNLKLDSGVFDLSSNVTQAHLGVGTDYDILYLDSSSGSFVYLLDNKKLALGSDKDLQLYSDGTDSFIDEVQGNLSIRNQGVGGKVDLGAESVINLKVDKTLVELNFNGSKRLETTLNGIKVTGNIEATGTIASLGDLSLEDLTITGGLDNDDPTNVFQASKISFTKTPYLKALDNPTALDFYIEAGTPSDPTSNGGSLLLRSGKPTTGGSLGKIKLQTVQANGTLEDQIILDDKTTILKEVLLKYNKLSTDQLSFTLFDTPDTLDIGPNASSLSLGKNAGTLSIRNPAILTPNLTSLTLGTDDAVVRVLNANADIIVGTSGNNKTLVVNGTTTLNDDLTLATGKKINKVLITPPTTISTLTIEEAKTLLIKDDLTVRSSVILGDLINNGALTIKSDSTAARELILKDTSIELNQSLQTTDTPTFDQLILTSAGGLTGAVRADRTLTISGTPNQVSVDVGTSQDLTADRQWTLSLPQNIHSGATPQFAGLTLTGQLNGTAATFSGALQALTVETTSTIAAKNAVKDFTESALSILSSLNIVEYEYNDLPSVKRIGIIAEETKDIRLSGEYKNKFDLANAVGLLIKAVQELNNKIG